MPAKVPLRPEIITNPTSITGMNNHGVPLEEVVIYVEGGDIRWTDHPDEFGTLSTTVGTLLADGQSMSYKGDFSNWRCIAAASTPTIRIHKYSYTVRQ
jgi:hypothetical protein